MPSPEEHAKLSKTRTGNSFIGLHEWIDEGCTNQDIPKRHDITKIHKNLEIVKEKFGNEAVEEFLYHIEEDYEKNKAYKLVNLLSAIKVAVFSPLGTLKNYKSTRK